MKILDKGFLELVDHMGDDKKVVNSARVSFNGNDEENKTVEKKDIKLIEYLLRNNHSSPLEHVVFTFLVKTPLFVARQWMRHRTWSFNEVSRRYTSEEIDFYVPEFLRKQSEDNKQASTEEEIHKIDGIPIANLIKDNNERCMRLYDYFIENGVAREQARMVLPQNMYTKYYGTVNLWNLLKFLDLRNHKHSQLEIRVYAVEILKQIKSIVPNVISIWNKLKKEAKEKSS